MTSGHAKGGGQIFVTQIHEAKGIGRQEYDRWGSVRKTRFYKNVVYVTGGCVNGTTSVPKVLFSQNFYRIIVPKRELNLGLQQPLYLNSSGNLNHSATTAGYMAFTFEADILCRYLTQCIDKVLSYFCKTTLQVRILQILFVIVLLNDSFYCSPTCHHTMAQQQHHIVIN